MTDAAATYPIVLGTAGHIDHGKTALVEALTGIDTDRLKVEKERGITTELGFAHLDLGKRRFGVVDVPGHERFIKSMVAGAGGLDLVCLVIAADEGIMPQTREHLDICELLRVRRGVVALTKSDLVDADWLDLVREEVRVGLAGSFLESAALIPVSARTGAGLDDLKAELSRLADELDARPADGLFRMPLDRVFTIKGFGTVVTGTILGGRVRAGDAVVAHPQAVAAKVRGIELHGDHVDEARAGMRCALNLSGASRDDLTRGDMLAHPDALAPSHLIDASFRYLRTSRGPLGPRSRVLVHHGTSQLTATLVLVDTEQLAPGQEALVQLRLDIDTPLAALPGDRFIARGFVIQEHYGTTIGGGEILRVHAPKSKRSSARSAEALEAIARASADERVALEIKASDSAGMTVDTIVARLGLPQPELVATLARLAERGDVVVAGRGATALYCHAEPLARLEKRAVDALAQFHETQPERDAMPREELRARLAKALAPRMFDQVVAALERREAIVADRDQVRQAGARTRAGQATVDALDEKVAAVYRDGGITPVRPQDVPAQVGRDAKDVRAASDRLLAAGQLVRVKSDFHVDAGALGALREKLVAHLDAHGEITPGQWKQITGASRKFSIPLAEYFDAEKLTLRVGDVRKRRG